MNDKSVHSMDIALGRVIVDLLVLDFVLAHEVNACSGMDTGPAGIIDSAATCHRGERAESLLGLSSAGKTSSVVLALLLCKHFCLAMMLLMGPLRRALVSSHFSGSVRAQLNFPPTGVQDYRLGAPIAPATRS